MLVAEFSLINTRTFEVKAAFSATGEGQDMRVVTGGSRVVPSRGKVVSEVSKSLGIDVARQINEQLRGNNSDDALENVNPTPGNTMQEGEVMHFSQ
jgi:hypothetical protein